MEKSSNDDKYIQALKSELDKLKGKFSSLSQTVKNKEIIIEKQSKAQDLPKLPTDNEKVIFYKVS